MGHHLRAKMLLITCHRYLLYLVRTIVLLCANSMIAQIRQSVRADASNLHPRCITPQQSLLAMAKYGKSTHGKNKEKNECLL